jgi:hypothetical protein
MFLHFEDEQLSFPLLLFLLIKLAQAFELHFDVIEVATSYCIAGFTGSAFALFGQRVFEALLICGTAPRNRYFQPRIAFITQDSPQITLLEQPALLPISSVMLSRSHADAAQPQIIG